MTRDFAGRQLPEPVTQTGRTGPHADTTATNEKPATPAPVSVDRAPPVRDATLHQGARPVETSADRRRIETILPRARVSVVSAEPLAHVRARCAVKMMLATLDQRGDRDRMIEIRVIVVRACRHGEVTPVSGPRSATSDHDVPRARVRTDVLAN